MRLGLLGYGYWGQKWARVIHETNRLGWIAEIDQDRRIEAGNEYPDATIIEDPDYDSVEGLVIATPPRSHYPIAMEAIGAGKHVLVEKPMTMDTGFARELAGTARSRGLVLQVGHTFLYDEAVQQAIQLVSQIGQINHIHMEWSNKGVVRDDVDVLWNVGPHPLSILREIIRLSPNKHVGLGFNKLKNDRADIMQVALHYAHGVTASLRLSWLSPTKRRYFHIVGEHGDIVCDADERVTKLCNPSGGVERTWSGPWEEPLKAELRDFVESAGSHRLPRADGLTSGAVVVDLCQTLGAALPGDNSEEVEVE